MRIQERSSLCLIILDSLEKLEAKEAKSVVNKRLLRLRFHLFIYLILPCGEREGKMIYAVMAGIG